MVECCIKEYFKSNPQSAKSLFDVLRGHENLRQHFYIPMTVVILCFVYCKSNYQLPSSLSKLYEKFVLLCIRSNIPESQRKQFKTLQSVPSKLRPVFNQLCELALKKLVDKKLVFDEEELEDLPIAKTDRFDGFGLLHIEHVTDEFGDRVKSYSFIHRAVQELLAAILILESKTVEDAINKYFSKTSYLSNVFPFIFGLMPKEDLKPIVERVKEIYIQSNGYAVLLNRILYCLFEAQDELLCSEFGKVFNITNHLVLMPYTLLDYHYAFYFLSTCKLVQLHVTCPSLLTDIHVEVMAKYLSKSCAEMVSFSPYISLQLTGVVTMCKILSSQHNMLGLNLNSKFGTVHVPGCIEVLCDSICKHHLHITTLKLPSAKLHERDLDSLGCAIADLKSLELLDMRTFSFSDGTSLKSSKIFCDALCNTKCLKIYTFGRCWFSVDDIDLFSDILSQNKSIKQVDAFDVDDANVVTSILQGLSSNQSITSFSVWPGPLDTSHMLGQSLGKCLASNQTLTVIDFTSFGFYEPMENLQWSSEHVCCICTGLQSNNSLVTLDISGGYIDKTASDAVCVMLSINISLKHLFLNPVHLEKVGAVAIFNSCINNTTLELLTLVWLPGGELARAPWRAPWSSSHPSELKLQFDKEPMWSTESIFPFAEDSEIITILDQVQRCRQDKKKPPITILWKYIKFLEAKFNILKAIRVY
ncbi:NACHT, LRR and PYD domains-containing protein 4C-like isoform X1 [Dysidea avara]|uniref:NACHT, LRR and PYD domains-containing protein 4C-like isoform X1 n=1 Tax=Dysidea avara TaxID=196820 RepID=UPI0033345577